MPKAKSTKPKTSKSKAAKAKFSEVVFKKQIATYFTKNAAENYPQKDLVVLAGNFLIDFPKYQEFYNKVQIAELFKYQK